MHLHDEDKSREGGSWEVGRQRESRLVPGGGSVQAGAPVYTSFNNWL